ncbi:hypothetical protein H8356DRAFT_1619403 [Neocallimastix lanati (nom. inval.)]|jgi:hypothetical protein|uniref:Uncharacterized protein n=1 Tax=Neocallimastix californiae TaxID=1754190 RepID=A0A1Y2DUG0_9FUNG|nr:hypothetical protein H8356DRAFT_1619403 [Neocallimastix sp. JGI-2020a]ORY62776.1 hypothetical protein LY90DRAFT_701000 [Neocallimastix californiae]|eukprot:ORY62776.1 hypothetical protein LY90DRAFT_701000 [Neocallimastix californiae]
MRIYEFITLMILGVYVDAALGSKWKWPDHNWNINFSTVNVNLNDNTKDQLVIKSIDAGLFSKDIDEETYCRYTYSQPANKHYILCHAAIKNYSSFSSAKTYYFYMDFGKDQEPDCNDGYDMTSKSKMYFDVVNIGKGDTKYLGELKYNKFAKGKTLPFENGVTKKAFRLINDYCFYYLYIDKIEILDRDPNY